MSTSAPPVVTSQPIHPSWFARAGTWVLHEAKVVKDTVLKIVGFSDRIAQEVTKVAPTVEALSNLISPGAGNFEQHLLDVYGVVASAVDTAGEAAAANGLNLSIDAGLASQVRNFLPLVKSKMAASASGTPPPKP